MSEKLICGVGIYDLENITNPIINLQGRGSKHYKVWKSMLERCYAKNARATNTVCDEWLKYSIFVIWMETQDWKNRELDKDIRVPGNRHYSPDTCVFVPGYINSLIREKTNGLNPIGVIKYYGRFKAYVNHNGIRKYYGPFNTISEATNAYIMAKAEIIEFEACDIKGLQSELIKLGLMKHRVVLLNSLLIV